MSKTEQAKELTDGLLEEIEDTHTGFSYGSLVSLFIVSVFTIIASFLIPIEGWFLIGLGLLNGAYDFYANKDRMKKFNEGAILTYWSTVLVGATYTYTATPVEVGTALGYLLIIVFVLNIGEWSGFNDWLGELV